MPNYTLKKKLFFFVILVAAVALFSHFGLLNPINNILIKVFATAQNILARAATRVPIPKNINNPLLENALLKEQNQKLLIDNIRLKQKLAEIKNLQNHLQYLDSQKYKFVQAKIISRGPSHNNVFTINIGKKDGVASGLPVVANEGIFVGKIIQAEDLLSQVLPATHTQSKIAVSKYDEDEVSGILSGVDGYYMKMELIPNEKKISPGDKIVTAAGDFLIPAGLFVGEVERMENNGTSYFKTALIKPLLASHTLSSVAVLKTNEF